MVIFFKRQSVDMCNGPVFKNVIGFTIPLIFSGILQLLFNAADLIIVGQQKGGELFVAAVGSTTSLTHVIVNVFIGFSIGAGVSTAYSLGVGNSSEVKKTVHTAIATALICGVLIMTFGLVFSNKLLIAMNTPNDIIEYASVYLRIYFCGAVFLMLYNFGAAILRAAGDTTSPLIYLTVAGVLNVVLNLVFVNVFGMNVDGVAYATIISQAISAVLVMLKLIRRDDACKFDFRALKLHKIQLKKIFVIGLPAGVQTAAMSLSNVIIQSSINGFGPIAVSGISAAISIDGFAYVAINAYNQTVMNFTSKNLGAGNYKRIKKIILVCALCGAVTAAVVGLILIVFSNPLLSIYIPDSPDAVEYGAVRLLFFGYFYVFCGLMEVMTGSVRGLGSSVVPMIITLVGACAFRVVWINTIFKLFPTLKCIYLSYPISWFLVFAAGFVALMIIWKKKIVPLENDVNNSI